MDNFENFKEEPKSDLIGEEIREKLKELGIVQILITKARELFEKDYPQASFDMSDFSFEIVKPKLSGLKEPMQEDYISIKIKHNTEGFSLTYPLSKFDEKAQKEIREMTK